MPWSGTRRCCFRQQCGNGGASQASIRAVERGTEAGTDISSGRMIRKSVRTICYWRISIIRLASRSWSTACRWIKPIQKCSSTTILPIPSTGSSTRACEPEVQSRRSSGSRCCRSSACFLSHRPCSATMCSSSIAVTSLSTSMNGLRRTAQFPSGTSTGKSCDAISAWCAARSASISTTWIMTEAPSCSVGGRLPFGHWKQQSR